MPYCVAPECRNASTGPFAHTDVTFHQFPLHKPKLVSQWVAQIGRTDLKPNRFTRLCSEHFDASCFAESPAGNYAEVDLVHGAFRFTMRLLRDPMQRVLKEDAVPGVFRRKYELDGFSRKEELFQKHQIKWKMKRDLEPQTDRPSERLYLHKMPVVQKALTSRSTSQQLTRETPVERKGTISSLSHRPPWNNKPHIHRRIGKYAIGDTDDVRKL